MRGLATLRPVYSGSQEKGGNGWNAASGPYCPGSLCNLPPPTRGSECIGYWEYHNVVPDLAIESMNNNHQMQLDLQV